MNVMPCLFRSLGRLQKDQARKRSISQGLQEEELRSASSRRNAGPARRSLFRRKKHQRNNSDSKEHSEGSVTDVPIQEGQWPTTARFSRLFC